MPSFDLRLLKLKIKSRRGEEDFCDVTFVTSLDLVGGFAGGKISFIGYTRHNLELKMPAAAVLREPGKNLSRGN